MTAPLLNRRAVLRLLPAAALLPEALLAAETGIPLLIGTGTSAASTSKGIYVAQWDGRRGTLSEPKLIFPIASPTFLALTRSHRFLYALSEIEQGKVTALRWMPEKETLAEIDAQPSLGAGPAHVSVTPDGSAVFVANYGGGSITSYRVLGGGRLSEPVSHFQYSPTDSQPEHAQSHAHEVTPSPGGRWLLVNDLGLDRILVYRIEGETAKLTPGPSPMWQARLGSGPRHLAFHPNGRWVYNINERDSTIDPLLWDGRTGKLTANGTFVSTLAPDFPKGKAFASEIVISGDGRFVYAGNRRNETIAMLTINAGSGALNLRQLQPHGGRTARHIALDPTGRWLLVAAQDSGEIIVLPRDPESGKLSEPSHRYSLSSPQCLIFAG